MIYYSLSSLLKFGINEICIISNDIGLKFFRKLFGDGKKFGCTFEYIHQEKSNGIAEAFILAENFIGDDPVCLILGDNFFHASNQFFKVEEPIVGGTVFAYRVEDPERYGVVDFDKNNVALSIEEKPKKPKSNYAVTGLYFYDNDVVDISKNLKPSARGELEITDVNNVYLKRGTLKVKVMPNGSAWLDAGTAESFFDTSSYIRTIQRRQGVCIGCLESICLEQNFIDIQQFDRLLRRIPKSSYKDALRGKFL
jgi:glucose-1-phosphate thymidylyltransferase